MEVDKMQIPGWRIEQKFNNRVLIGNWNEELQKFQKENKPFGNSTHRLDFQPVCGNYLPDIKVRREAAMRNEGLPKKFIFSHDSGSNSNNLISWYDQQMNQRELHESTLPKLRKWDGKSTSFTPEKSDLPLQGRPTNFGLHDKMTEKWKKEVEKESLSDFESTYKHSYNLYPTNGSVQQHHFAPPKLLSSHFITHNRVNNNLHFRNHHTNVAPEFIPS